MSWVPLHLGPYAYTIYGYGTPVAIEGNVVTCDFDNGDPEWCGWELEFLNPQEPVQVRVIIDSFYTNVVPMFSGEFWWNDVEEGNTQLRNGAVDGPPTTEFQPDTLEFGLRTSPYCSMWYSGPGFEVPAEVAQYQMHIEVWDPNAAPPEPVAECFWTDLVGVTQACLAPPLSGSAQFVNDEGHGSGSGAFQMPYLNISDEPAEGLCDPAVFAALTEALSTNDVTITGLMQRPDIEDSVFCGEPITPETITWQEVSLPMEAYTTIAGDTMFVWNNGSDEVDLPQNRWFAVRVVIAGGTYYGYLYMGSGV